MKRLRPTSSSSTLPRDSNNIVRVRLITLVALCVSSQPQYVSCTTNSQLRFSSSRTQQQISHHDALSRSDDSQMKIDNGISWRESNIRKAQELSVKVTNLFLVDTGTGKDIMELVDGSSYDVATLLPSTNFTIRAVTTTPTVDECYMIHFDLDYGQLTHDGSIVPYTLVGNVFDGDPNSPYLPSGILKQVGSHAIFVKPVVCPTNDNKEVFFTEGFVDEATTTSEASETLGVLETNKLGTILSGGMGEVTVTATVPDDVNAFDEDDGALQISFTVHNGAEPFPPTPAPVPVTDVVLVPSSVQGTISGKLRVWNTITIGFIGPLASEMDSSIRGPYGPLNTYKDFRCDITFTHIPTRETYMRPCYFNLDGDAANSHNKSVDGTVWTVHFVPKYIGIYDYKASFRYGINCAPNGGGDPAGFFDGSEGEFEIIDNDRSDELDMLKNDLRRKGKLQYVGKSLLQFTGTKESFIAAGPDSPENLLAYQDFDDTSNFGNYSKSYSSHIADFNNTNVSLAANTWSDGKGIGIMGAVNYLASKGMNTISITTLTIDGVDGNVHPFSLSTDGGPVNPLHYDASKLNQWSILFDWLSKIGIVARIKLSDALSNDYFDGGQTFEYRRLYYREMISRFGHHLGVIWDLGEDVTNVREIKQRAAYIRLLDPYTPLMVQTIEQNQSSVYDALLDSDIDCISVVSTNITRIGLMVAEWANKSAAVGKPIVITNDKQGTVTDGIVSDAVDKVRTSVRQNVIWNPIMYGGAGSRFYFGSNDDVNLQNFRTRDTLFTQASLALQFFNDNNIPLADMKSSTLLSRFPMLQTVDGRIKVIYKGPGSLPPLTLPIGGQSTAIYSLKWYSPSTGKYVGPGSSPLKPGTSVSLGSYSAPSSLDWVALVTCTNNCGLRNLRNNKKE